MECNSLPSVIVSGNFRSLVSGKVRVRIAEMKAGNAKIAMARDRLIWPSSRPIIEASIDPNLPHIEQDPSPVERTTVGNISLA